MDTCLNRFNTTLSELISDVKTVYPNLENNIIQFSEKYDVENNNSKKKFHNFNNE